MTIAVIGITIALIILAQNLIYKKHWQTNLDVHVSFSTKEAFEGDVVSVNQKLTNRKLLPLPWLATELVLHTNLGGGLHDILSIKRFERLRSKTSIKCLRRGFYAIRHMKLSCSNILHTVNYEATAKVHSELTVFPRLLDDCDDLKLIYKNLDVAITSKALTNPDPFEFRGIRDYKPTDSMRDINFKATAIAQELMVNIHAPTMSKRLEIVLNLQPHGTGAIYETQEQAIRIAATIAEHFMSEGVQVGFYTNGRGDYFEEPSHLPMGQSSAHLYAIFTSLAHIRLSFSVEPISEYLMHKSEADAVYAIISSYKGADFDKVLEHLNLRSIAHVVITPKEVAAP